MKLKNSLYIVSLSVYFSIFLSLSFSTSVFAESVWRLNLNQVQVVQTRENSGDRPYFVTIHFQTRLNIRNQTRVSLHSMEPNDWVSKREYNLGRLSRGDHMSNGETLRIPWWQSEHEWRRLFIARDALGAFTAPIFGAIVIGLDNNNTPPHIVRGLAQQVADRLVRVLRDQIETGAIIRGVDIRSPGAITTIRNRINSFSSSLTANLNINLFDWTFGSTFNPDRITGIHAFVFPAIEGLALATSTSNLTIAGSPVTLNVTAGAPSIFARNLDFMGSGAHYRVGVLFTTHRLPEATPLRSLTLKLRVGDDDLRRNSQAFAILTHKSLGTTTLSTIEFPLNRGANWPNRLDATRSLPLPPGVTLNDLASLKLSYQSGSTGPFDTTDNWNVDALSLTAVTEDGRAEFVNAVQGLPLVRFTDHNKEILFGLTR